MKEPVGYLIKQITDKIKVSADASLKTRNLTLSQARVLEFISNQGGKVTQKSIESYLGVSHPTVVGIVSRMEKNGYLCCYYEKDDKRNKIVAMTQLATDMSHAMRDEMTAQEAKFLQGLTETDVDNLYRMLNIIYKNVD